ncbi:uncharacterized protein LOC120624554 [Pararge aegeria]|uniref:Jg19165 protein n=2 Tax=Pararge aegeria TaxID=116150 RepID=A0A8S4RC28_9NEOP|nr:uncharacterized protein LOC120624554 [Pararge aegeria]CAH2232362.1 jg19165 [Pararge aegeria aegeria]
MDSMPSDAESNVSGFIRYSDEKFKHLYKSMIQNMEIINQDIMQVEKNMKNIVQQAGPLESQLSALLQTLPKPNITLPMETE